MRLIVDQEGEEVKVYLYPDKGRRKRICYCRNRPVADSMVSLANEMADPLRFVLDYMADNSSICSQQPIS